MMITVVGPGFPLSGRNMIGGAGLKVEQFVRPSILSGAQTGKFFHGVKAIWSIAEDKLSVSLPDGKRIPLQGIPRNFTVPRALVMARSLGALS